jgi:uncharacterized protein
MPEYLAPGVYVEEIETGPRPIEGVSTSTAGFVGETERGPTRPRLVTSWPDYQRWYGTYIDQPPLNANNFYLPYAVRGFFDNGGQRLFVARVTGAASIAAQANVVGAGGNTVIEANGRGRWGNYIQVAVKQASAAQFAKAGSPVLGWFRLQIAYFRLGIPVPYVDPTDLAQLANPNRVEPDAFEDFDNLTADPTQPNFAITVVNGGSNLVTILACPGAPAVIAFPGINLVNGSYVVATQADYGAFTEMDPHLKTGINALAAIREISLMAVPDEVVPPLHGVADDLQDVCDSMRDRFAILSDQVVDGNGNVQGVMPPRDSSYGAFYYPWIRVAVPHTPDGTQLIPMTGHMAGIYARVDVERGVHKAPANEVIRGIISRDLNGDRKPLSHTLAKAEQDILNPRGVNVARDFRSDGRDIRMWGARTMSSDSMWKYINVRRLFIFIEQSIDRGTQWAVFEPNSEPTWIALRMSITNFLRTVWRNGALMGTTPEEAFFVKCDLGTMSQDDLDNGRLICLIGIAPVKPAEFVIFRISQKTIDATS